MNSTVQYRTWNIIRSSDMVIGCGLVSAETATASPVDLHMFVHNRTMSQRGAACAASDLVAVHGGNILFLAAFVLCVVKLNVYQESILL